MKHIRICLVALIVLTLSAAKAHAATNVWTTGFPKPGFAVGTIDVEGTFTPDGGATIAAQASVVVWAVGSGPAQTVPVNINVNNGFWRMTLPGLTSGKEYNIVVQATQRLGGVSTVVYTDPGKSKAK